MKCFDLDFFLYKLSSRMVIKIDIFMLHVESDILSKLHLNLVQYRQFYADLSLSTTIKAAF